MADPISRSGKRISRCSLWEGRIKVILFISTFSRLRDYFVGSLSNILQGTLLGVLAKVLHGHCLHKNFTDKPIKYLLGMSLEYLNVTLRYLLMC